MRIRIAHETTFTYAPSARTLIYNLRLTPRSFDAQYVLRWRITTDIDGTLRHSENSLGNIVHSLSYTKPVERFTVSAIGEVETATPSASYASPCRNPPNIDVPALSPLAMAMGAVREFGQRRSPASQTRWIDCIW